MRKGFRRTASLFSGVILFALVVWLQPLELSGPASLVFGVAVLMITWWVTEALPMPVVALLPLILFPLMGVSRLEEVAAPYASPVIFLFMGGFMIGLAIENWALHKRIALSIVRLTGTKGDRIVLGFILATGFMSMWLSNTATTMMMYPIAMSVISVMEANNEARENTNNLGVCLLLAIAYASNFGGIATIIGTPPNVAYVAFLEKHNGYTFQFADWMKIGMPLSVILLLTLYLVMTKWLYPTRIKADTAASEHVADELRKMGKLSTAEKRVLFVFSFTALLWITKDLINSGQDLLRLDDTMIALLGALMLFIIPSGKDGLALLTWSDTSRMAWGILLLFGGGISLATQLEKAGLIQSLGSWMAGFATGGLMLVFTVTIISIFISEVMSNVAQVIVFAPVVAGIADALQINPLQIGVAMTLAASCASMLPMGTPPNAIVFASGRLKLKHMTATGFVMNIISAVLITAFCWYLLPVMVEWIP